MPAASPRSPALLVALLVAAQLALAGWWLRADRFPFGFEVVEHLLYVQLMVDDWRAGMPLSDWIDRHRAIGHRASALHMLLAPILAADPSHAGLDRITLIASALTLPLLAWATYELGRQATRTSAGAAACAAAVLLLPPVWGFSRKLGVDLPLTAIVTALAAWLLREPTLWAHPRRAAAFGVCAGLGCLVKAQLVLWLPCIALPSWLAAGAPRRGATLSALAAATTSAPYWLGGLRRRASWAEVAFAGPHSDTPTRWSLDALTYYLQGLPGWLGWGTGPVVAIGLLSVTTRVGRPPDDSTARRALVAWSLGGLIVWTAWPIKWMRYLLPALPALVTLGVAGCWTSRAGRVLVGAGLAVATTTMLAGTFAYPITPTTLCHPPRTLEWRAPVDQATAELTAWPRHRQPQFIALDGPADWSEDKYSLLQLILLQRFPGAEIQRRSDRRSAADLRQYEAMGPRVDLRVHILPAGATAPGTTWLRRGPIALPDLGQPAWQLWLDVNPRLADPHRSRPDRQPR